MVRDIQVFFLSMVLVSWVFEAQARLVGLVDGETGDSVSMESVVEQVNPGDVVILSEEHGNEIHHGNQRALLQALAQKNLTVSVGMEHLYMDRQVFLDSYLNGNLVEADFLSRMLWGKGLAFDHYREQVLFPLNVGGWTVALKAPSWLTRKVFLEGLDSLNDSERAWLPPGFTLGNDKYYKRIKEFIDSGGHGGPEMVQRTFSAQSIWDETMSFRAIEYINQNPDHVLVILVGDFHAAYGGGLPDRLRQRGSRQVLVISQVNRNGLTEEQAREEVLPHSEYGQRAEFVWVTDSSRVSALSVAPLPWLRLWSLRSKAIP